MRPDRRSHDAAHRGAAAPFAAHWGQIEAWSNFSEIGPVERHLVVRSFPLAKPAPESAVRRAIGTLVARHEGLRTILVPAGDENLTATALTDPEPDVCFVSDDDGDDLPPQFSDPPLDPTDRMPVRFGLRRAGAAIDAVTCAAVHTAADVWGTGHPRTRTPHCARRPRRPCRSRRRGDVAG